MWIYNSSNGALSHNGILAGTGYSGHQAGINNPEMESIHNTGPIPRGSWTISHFFNDPGGKGPVVARLSPDEGTETFGRGGFMIHGDNAQHNEGASYGCIILARSLREQIATSGDSILQVV